MVDDSKPNGPAPEPQPGPDDASRCPWCSAVLPAQDASVCPSCQAHLIDEQGVEIPGVTTLYPGLLAPAGAPRPVRRSLGSLFVGGDDEVPPPSEAELPALAPPDVEVRREMLRLELDARLASLQAEVKAIEAEDGIRPNVMADPSEEIRPNVIADPSPGAGAEPSSDPPGDE